MSAVSGLEWDEMPGPCSRQRVPGAVAQAISGRRHLLRHRAARADRVDVRRRAGSRHPSARPVRARQRDAAPVGGGRRVPPLRAAAGRRVHDRRRGSPAADPASRARRSGNGGVPRPVPDRRRRTRSARASLTGPWCGHGSRLTRPETISARVPVRASTRRLIRPPGQELLPLRSRESAPGDLACLPDERREPDVPAVRATVVVGGEEVGAVGREERNGRGVGAPGSGAPSASPLATSHRRTVPSALPVASFPPSGLNATLWSSTSEPRRHRPPCRASRTPARGLSGRPRRGTGRPD